MNMGLYNPEGDTQGGVSLSIDRLGILSKFVYDLIIKIVCLDIKHLDRRLGNSFKQRLHSIIYGVH